MNKGILLGIGTIVVIVIGVLGYLASQKNTTTQTQQNENVEAETVTPTSTPINNEGIDINKQPNSTGETAGDKLKLTGLLASNYYLFDAANFEIIKQSNTPYYLNFYANWCPTCAGQEKIDFQLFNDIADTNSVIALRVNTLDSDTDSDEEDLAKELGVRFQHTLIFFNGSGEETGRLIGTSTADTIQAELDKAAGL